ncbi:hypothetical protein [Neopusillimonas aestuarii]|uniref:hypothetical protein n=1 Tax=Neopusillimonas aestuarii TaxID=2716226 RepID=UPI00197FEEC5|nr:hypothetical protein [Pusillimonas sp. DMV24BSW_D]
MTVELVRAEIQRFLETDDRIALCLSGKWGVGKTHTWDTLLAQAFSTGNVSPARYSYVSLFGLESLGDVRRSLFENTVESAAFKPAQPFQPTLNRVSNRLSQLASKWRAGTGVIRGLPIIADYSSLVEKAGFLDVRDQIVCFDDLERMSDKLALKDVLGLISILKERKRCKVILLLNSEVLTGNNDEAFRIQLEKIIDIKLEFSPTPMEAAAIAVPDQTSQKFKWVADNAIALGISNIRTIFKLLRIANRLEEILSSYDERILKQAIHSACLYGFALYQPTDAPPIEKIVNSTPWAHLFAKEEAKTPEENRWLELLDRYDYGSTDAFDLQVLSSLRQGYFDVVGLKREAEISAANLILQDHDKSFTEAWDLYHDSFDENDEEFASRLKQSIRDNAAAISPANLSASIAVLKKIGRADGISDVIKQYVNSRNEDKVFWSGDEFDPHCSIDDPDVQSAFAEKATEFEDDKHLPDVLAGIVRTSGWSEGTLKFINSHSEQDLYELLKQLKGEELRLAIYGLTNFRRISNADELMQSITTKAMAVLQRIGQESPINRSRVEKFGIAVPSSDVVDSTQID